MNASDFTHFMKTAGGGSKMWIGLVVFCLIAYWLGNPENRRNLKDGLFV